jgi:hypothetical protein
VFAVGIEEDLHHLFSGCSFASAVSTVQIFLSRMTTTWKSSWIVSRLSYIYDPCFFMEIMITMCWVIWTMRNDTIFKTIPHSVQRCKLIFNEEFALVILKAKTKFHPHIKLQLEAYVYFFLIFRFFLCILRNCQHFLLYLLRFFTMVGIA